METCGGRNGTPDGRTLGLIGPGHKLRTERGGNQTGEVKHGSCVELLWAIYGREAQTSVDGRRAGAPSRWTVDPRPGKRGGEEEGATIERSGVDRSKMGGGDTI